MEPFRTHSGTGLPLRRSNVDTDQILPARYLQRIERDGFGEFLFARWREDPDFPLSQPRFARASIIVAEPDFGTGSSREHAVWAIQQAGFRVVVSARFGDIFRGNAANSGLLAAQVDESHAEELLDVLEDSPGAEIRVDLGQRTISWGDRSIPFSIPEDQRTQLWEGRDAIAASLLEEDRIAAYECRRSTVRARVLRQDLSKSV